MLVRATNTFYENGTPRDAVRPPRRFRMAALRFEASRIVVGGGYGWFYQTPAFSGNAAAAPLFTSPPFAQSFTNTDASNNLSTFEQPFPATTLGYVLAHALVATLRPCRRARVSRFLACSSGT